MRATHRLFLRCEVVPPETLALFERLFEHPRLSLVSIVDRSSGQRQFARLGKYRLCYMGKYGLTSAGTMFSVDAVMRAKTGWAHPPWLEKLLQWGLRRLLHEREFIEFAANYPDLRGLDCVERVLEHFGFRAEMTAADLANIPTGGPVLLVANHPIGSLDGLALVKMVAAVRPDVKIMANQLLSCLEPLREVFLAVENMDGQTPRRQIRIVQQHLRQGGALIVFPAGEVSRFGWKGVRDGKWNSGFIRLGARARAPIVPIHVRGRNSWCFYVLSLVCKPLSTCLLVHEMFGQRGKTLEIRIGNRIPYFSWYNKETTADKLAARFRRHVNKIGKGKPGHFSGEAPIALPEDRAALEASMERCEILGRTPDEKIIYLYRRLDTETFSPILHELGRLREIAFRAVGEGTGCALDLDWYDDDYYHLILWDTRQAEIVGAYRFVPTAERVRQRGIKSLYSHSLFRYRREMNAILENGIELGRSFIQPAYWGKRGLDYLWQGIGAYLARYPQYRYLFGAVSISGALPESARDLLVSFYRLYFPPRRAIAVSRRPYPASLPQMRDNFGGTSYHSDLQRLKSMLKSMNCSIPTLYKQYSELCEPGGVQFIDFGVDPAFGNCIDGLVLVDISMLKLARYRRYIASHLGEGGERGR